MSKLTFSTILITLILVLDVFFGKYIVKSKNLILLFVPNILSILLKLANANSQYQIIQQLEFQVDATLRSQQRFLNRQLNYQQFTLENCSIYQFNTWIIVFQKIQLHYLETVIKLLRTLLEIERKNYQFNNTYEFSNSITKFLQNKFEYGQEQGTFEYFLLIFSTAGDAIVTNILAILIWFKATNKEQVLKIFTMNALASSLGNLVKMISAQPRPFYIDDQIKLDFCYTGYGDPSGHSFRPSVFYVLLLETIVCKKYRLEPKQLLDGNQFYQNNQSQLTQMQQSISCYQRFKMLYPNSPISFKQCQFFLGIFIYLIGIGRLYFGVHFLNQIVIGWILGIYLLYIYYFCGLEQFIHSLYIEAKRIKDEKTCTKFAKYLNFGIMLSLLYLTTLIICYFRHYSQQILDEKEEWKKLILRQDTCLHKGHYSYEKKFETSDVQYISIIFFPLYLFILYEQEPEVQNRSPLKSWLSKNNILKLILYLFCYLIQGQQRHIIKLFEKGVPRLMITLIFEHIYYITYALFLLTLIPFIKALGNTFIFKFRKPTRSIQLEQFEIEL